MQCVLTFSYLLIHQPFATFSRVTYETPGSFIQTIIKAGMLREVIHDIVDQCLVD